MTFRGAKRKSSGAWPSASLPALVLLWTVAGCGGDGAGPPTDRLYIQGFVTIIAPAAVAAGQTIPVTFEMLMPDGCHSYDHRDVGLRTHRADVTLWGRISGEICLQTISTARTELLIPDATPGAFRIVVHIADGDSLVREVVVE
jgi:hypothetical protein